MNVLVLGGSIFLGRHLVDALLEGGHRVTTFARGVHPAPERASVARVLGDRTNDLSPLVPDGWDAVVDVCGYVPRVVRASVRHLAAAGRYAFVSSISVYDSKQAELDENSPTPALHRETETVDGETYGPLKAACERVVTDGFGERALVFRPGLIVGPFDASDRFTYWVERGARGGEMLAPAPPEHGVQFVDVRDVAAFVVRALEMHLAGTYNVTSEPQDHTFGDVVEAVCRAGNGNARTTWVDERFLEQHGVEPWSELPLWIPESMGEAGFNHVSVASARRDGLTFRPLATTVADTLTWTHTLDPHRTRKAGLDPEREQELLAAWHAPHA